MTAKEQSTAITLNRSIENMKSPMPINMGIMVEIMALVHRIRRDNRMEAKYIHCLRHTKNHQINIMDISWKT